MPAAWYTASNAKTELNLVVTAKGLAAAQEQCLRAKGLALNTAAAPSELFAQGVVYQALANKQAAAAAPNDEIGAASNGVRLYPLEKRIMAMLIIPAPVDGDTARDAGHVRSLVG